VGLYCCRRKKYYGENRKKDGVSKKLAGKEGDMEAGHVLGDNVEADAIIEKIPELITILGEWLAGNTQR
jgi:putative hydrolase of the HAD superfamily